MIIGSTYGLFGRGKVQIPYLRTLVGKKAGEGVVGVVALGTVVPGAGIEGIGQDGFELGAAYDAHFGHDVTNHQKCTTYLHQKCTTVYC